MKAKTLCEIELSRVLAIADMQEAVAVLLSHRAGLRACEIAATDWAWLRDASGGLAEDIDISPAATKAGTGGARLPLSADLRRALLRLSAARRHPRCGPVLLNAQGKRLSAHALAQRLNRLYRAAGLDGCTSHSGRRTFATRLAKSLPISDLQKVMRHADASTTITYVDPSADAVIADAVRALSA